MKIILEVANNKAEFLLELLRNLKFVKVTEAGDWYDDLSLADKRSIDEGLEDIKNDRVSEHHEVMGRARKRVIRKK
jgi:hypothetical protein